MGSSGVGVNDIRRLSFPPPAPPGGRGVFGQTLYYVFVIPRIFSSGMLFSTFVFPGVFGFWVLEFILPAAGTSCRFIETKGYKTLSFLSMKYKRIITLNTSDNFIFHFKNP
jgi:hypothetical protein